MLKITAPMTAVIIGLSSVTYSVAMQPPGEKQVVPANRGLVKRAFVNRFEKLEAEQSRQIDNAIADMSRELGNQVRVSKNDHETYMNQAALYMKNASARYQSAIGQSKNQTSEALAYLAEQMKKFDQSVKEFSQDTAAIEKFNQDLADFLVAAKLMGAQYLGAELANVTRIIEGMREKMDQKAYEAVQGHFQALLDTIVGHEEK